MRKIGFVSVGRSDYGIYLPILKEISRDSCVELCLIVSGTHLSSEFGYTANLIESDGFSIAERIQTLTSSENPEGIVQSMGLCLIGFAAAFARQKPDILVVLGDRFEMHAAALAALPFKIPIAHIHGGEETLGAFDNSLRHSISKLSHLHFASTKEYARRLIQMGEEPWRVMVSGAPSLDNLKEIKLLSVAELNTRYGLKIKDPPLMVTFHPVTLEYENTKEQMLELLGALDKSEFPVIFTMPNADTGSRIIRDMIVESISAHPDWQVVENFGMQGYFSLMSIAFAMVGNSSSGIIEAASFQLPVINIGTRQQGRIHSENVIDVGYTRSEIERGIEHVSTAEFRKKIGHFKNPYGDGKAAKRIVEKLKNISLDQKIIYKPFFDLDEAKRYV